MKRRSFFKAFRDAALVVALAPQLAFRARALPGEILSKDLAYRWSETGVASIMQLTFVDTTPDADKLLMDFQVGGKSYLSLKKSGVLKYLHADDSDLS